MLTTTHWTMVFRAASEERGSRRLVLGELLEKYWQPLYFYARRQGLSAEDAEDATQALMTKLVEGDFLATADPAKGRFRTYLLTYWKRFLIDRARSEGRIKRGGDRSILSLSGERGEEAWKLWSSTSQPGLDADGAYEAEWARSILRNTVEILRAEYASSQRELAFESLLPYLTVPVDNQTYLDVSKRMSVSLGAAKVALHRLRQRFAQTLRLVVQETLEDAGDLDSEIQTLMAYLRRQ